MANIIHLPDGRSMVHATFAEVAQEVDKAFQVGRSVPIDAAAPRRNICTRARKDYETRLTQEHEAALPRGHDKTPAPDAGDGGEHPDIE